MSYNRKLMQLRNCSLLCCAVILMLSAAASAQEIDGGQVRMSVPGVKGTLELNVGPTTPTVRVRPDGLETQLQAMGRADHLLITAFLQHVMFPASAEKCRAEWWSGTEKGMKSHNMKMEHLHQSMENEIARVEYTLPEALGAPIKQKNLHAYLGSGDLCAEIHMSKVLFIPEEQKLFDEVIATVKLLPDRAEKGETSTTLEIRQTPLDAAAMYENQLAKKKKDGTLDQDEFRRLTERRGISYAMGGDLATARRVFEDAIVQDPAYPMHYYDLACTFGEMGNLEKSLEQLRLAYLHKGEMEIPDPLKDSSFRKFADNDKFVQAVREMQKQ